MLKQTVTYTDFNNNERTEDLYFNLTEAELIQLQVDSPHGIEKELQDAIDGKDIREILAFIKMLIHKAYGIKSEDGRYFHKSEEITQNFVNSAMYNDLLLSLFENEGQRGIKFINDLMPANLIKSAQKSMGGEKDLKPTAREMFEQRRQESRVPQAEIVDDNSSEPIRRETFQKPPVTMTENVEDEERLAFEKWKAEQKNHQPESNISRPPHESGPGYSEN